MAQSVADQLVATLAAAGVKRVYGIAGDSLNAITDSLRRSKAIEWIHMRHEEAAAFAAGAEAHLTGELAVCAGSCGPGNLHLINGLFDCHRWRVPVLAIAAHIPSAEIGGGLFPGDPSGESVPRVQPLCELVSNASQMPRVLEIAIREALGKARRVGRGHPRRRRAAAAADAAGARDIEACCPAPPSSLPAPTTWTRWPSCSNDAKRVTLLCGAGCAGAHDRAGRAGGVLKAPIVHALRGKEHVEWDNPFDVGMTGLIGFSSGYYAMKDCDTLLMLGTDFPYRQFYPGARRRDRAGRHPAGETRAAARARSRRWSATSARRSRRCCRCSTGRPTAPSSTRAREHYAKARREPRRAGRRQAGPQT